MDLTYTPEQDAFRKEALEWLQANAPKEPLKSFDTQEGFEQHFYAGHSDIPVTHTQYDRDTHSLIVLFSDTLLPKDESTLASVLSQSNFNISSVQVEQRDQECVFIIQLEPKAKYFTAYRQISHRYPMAAFEFHSGAPEIYD